MRCHTPGSRKAMQLISSHFFIAAYVCCLVNKNVFYQCYAVVGV